MRRVAMQAIQLKLREASTVLGVSPKDLQNLVQFGVLQPRRKDRFFVFDRALLLGKRVVLAVCTGWMDSETMASCRKLRVLVGCRYGLHVGDGVLMSGG
jgi:hypothetical protein